MEKNYTMQDETKREVINETAALQYYSSCPKEELISALHKAVPLYQRIAEYEENAIEAQKKTRKHFKLLKVLIAIPIWVALIFIVGNIAYFFKADDVWLDVSVLLFPIVGTILIMLFINAKRNKRAKNKVEDIANQMKSFIQNNICPELFCLPHKYQYYTAADYILNSLEEMRADTLKEAINLYVEQMDRWAQMNAINELNQTALEMESTDTFIAGAVTLGLLFK